MEKRANARPGFPSVKSFTIGDTSLFYREQYSCDIRKMQEKIQNFGKYLKNRKKK